MDLFEQASVESLKQNAPLADRMRPRTLDEYIGQEDIVGKGRLLRRAIEADQLSSLIFYGPPGTGKTTLAKIIANTTRANFITLNAVLSGVKDIRESIGKAKDTFSLYQKRTILFIDEVHRFNKAQQDALLPHVESGIIILIGATTENPYFEVNKALVSRSRIFQLKKLEELDLEVVVEAALGDSKRGYGNKKITVEPAALKHLTQTANGDARTLLNALELGVITTKPNHAGEICLTLEIIEESIQKRAVLYDKDGDAHYDIISAFIKSIRGSDPDAALYWLAKMLYAGEDPRFIFRRMIILASEDIGLADPNALTIVMSAAKAYDYIGMPEGRFPLSEACLYLATAPKSNTTLALFDALRSVEQAQKDDVPNHLKDSSRDRDGFGHGEGYLYPHAYRDHWVEQQYLPSEFQGKVFYNPSGEGYEKKIKEQVLVRREAQLEAMMNYTERETYIWAGGSNGDWEKRTWEGEGDYLLELRRQLFDRAGITSGSLVLDLNAGTGFICSEALRRTDYGGVCALVHKASDWETLQSLYADMSEVEKPILIPVYEMSESDIEKQLLGCNFTHLIGRNIPDSAKKVLNFVEKQILNGAQFVATTFLPSKGSRVSDFLKEDVRDLLAPVEEKIYNRMGRIDFLGSLNFDESEKQSNRMTYTLKKRFSHKDLQYWFRDEEKSLFRELKESCPQESVLRIQEELNNVLIGTLLEWKSVVEFVHIKKR